MKTKTTLALFLTLLIAIPSLSQGFVSGFDGFSRKKTAYLTLNDGTEIEGLIASVDRKKGLIEGIMIKKGKKKQSYEAADIAKMYLPASGLTKFSNKMDVSLTVDKWDNQDVNIEYINDGYALFELMEVEFKKKNRMLLMQLVNPMNATKVKFYFDPWAPQTMRVGAGPLTVAGGVDKSFYVKLPNKNTFKLQKKNFEENIADLFYGCDTVISKVKEEQKWHHLPEYVAKHEACE